MKPKDYLICDNEYNSFNKTRGQINAILTEFEKQFRDSKFATSPEGGIVLTTISIFAMQLLKTREAIKANDIEAIKKLVKECAGMIVSTEGRAELLLNQSKK
ncbi:hypothetical protein [Candidatus Electronema sp. TJ]|uniref:hypothetical protein n=1 Tax=Candidatus Electronema sp. TJ TaxID=3401573 RepID=UPI003AA907BC